jgi:hypothetical protein
MDLIDYALEQNTDFRKFEQLSLEVLKLNGYENVKPVGGIDDEGMDGALVKYFDDDETHTVIFQVTLQDNINAKIYDTFKKLIKNGIDFNEVVLVTSNQINNTQAIKTKIRTLYKNKYKLEIIEKSSFALALSSDPTLFSRYFGELNSQLNSKLFDKRTLFTEDSSDTLTNSLLKCSILFTFNESSNHTRKALFDRAVLAIIVDLKEANIQEIVNTFEVKFYKIIPDPMVSTAVERLVKEGYVSKSKTNSSKYEASKSSIGKIESATSKIQQSTKALINDIISNVQSLYNDKIDKDTLITIDQNIKKGLGLFFRLHGLEYCDEKPNPLFKSFEFTIDKNSDITSIVKKSLPKELGEILVFCLGEVIKKPLQPQADTLAEWSKAFIGAQVMSLDPSLKEFQTTNLSKKTFLLDTDFLLYCIVKETKTSYIYKSLISELIKSGCNVVVNEDIIFEVIKHAEFAEGNYTYFKNAFDVIDDTIIEDKIRNIFVKGYYIASKSGALSPGTSFQKYLANYYEKTSPYEFMCEVIKLNVNKSIAFKKLEEIDLSVIPNEQFKNLSEAIYNETINTNKALYRTPEENREIADTDAKQFLTAMHLNKKDSSKITPTILPGDFYLVTSSTRTVRCAFKIGIKQNITINPTALLNIFDQIGVFTISSKEIVNLFDNPFLIEVVNHNWDDLKKLVDAGVDLKDKNIIRLGYDLNDAIHKHLTHEVTKEISESDGTESNAVVELDEYVVFAKTIKEKGYHFTPEIEALLDRFKIMEGDNKTKDEIIENLKNQAGVHLKKTNHYLNQLKKDERKK